MRLLRLFYRGFTWRRKTKEKLIYLTFDDGPSPELTPLILDLLDEYGWKATFFCTGEKVQKHPELYAEILNRGHRMGNHTFSHLSGFAVGIDEYLADVRKAQEYIDSNLFRPPYGRIRLGQKKQIKQDYEIVMWDLLTCDYSKKLTPEAILNKIKRQSRKGSIVLFHDSLKARNNVLAVLPRAIEFWNGEGYRPALL